MFLVKRKNRLNRVGFFVLWRGYVVGGLLVALDQFSKWWFQMRDLVVSNYGGVFGVWPTKWWVVVLLFLWLVVVGHWYRIQDKWTQWGVGLIVVGGLSNIIDRFLFDSVRDFIYYPWFGFYGNMADIYLFLGTMMVFIRGLLMPHSQRLPE